jgi:hypothetical protein
MLTDLLSDGGDAPLNITPDHSTYGRDGSESQLVSEDPEWKRKMLVAREQVMHCAEGKLTSMYVRYAQDAGLNVFDPQGRSAFVRGWAKEKGLLVSVCWEAFNELRKFMPMVSFVKVYGSADSVVSTITTKYTQQAKYRDRKGVDQIEGVRKTSTLNLGDLGQDGGYALDRTQAAGIGHLTAASSSTSIDALREGMVMFITTKLQPQRLVMEGIVKEVDRTEGSVTLMLKAIDGGACSQQEPLDWRQVGKPVTIFKSVCFRTGTCVCQHLVHIDLVPEV